MFKKGDHVTVIDENLSGVVAFAKAEQISFTCKNGFSHLRHSKDLILDRSLPSNALENIEFKDKKKKAKKASASRQHLEVDLHLQEILSYSSNLSNHQKVLTQMAYAKEKFEQAKSQKIKKIVFIHGVGKGKLRKELRQFLNSQSNINYYDADYQSYGMGATEVVFYKFD